MAHILLINPNTSAGTTAMMTEIARASLPAGFTVEGLTAERGPPMILDPEALLAAAAGVVDLAHAHAGKVQSTKVRGIIVSAFGDPGLDELRAKLAIPATGLCEASMLEAAMGGRRFGIATVTPDLVPNFAATAKTLGLGHLYTGTRLTDGDPEELAADHEKLTAALEIAVRDCIEKDGAQAVIIGGGPLGQAAETLQHRFSTPVIAPIRCAAHRIAQLIGQPDMPERLTLASEGPHRYR